VPAKTSQEKVAKLTEWITSALRDPDVRSKIVAVGLYPTGVCGTDFGALIRQQYKDYGNVIRLANIKAE